jgi:mono/diheme cytochrome c family protein
LNYENEFVQAIYRMQPDAIPRLVFCFLSCVIAIAGCRQQMADQPRYDPLEASAFFADGGSARSPVPGTVARGELRDDAHFFYGITAGIPAKIFPFPITLEALQRGRERYDIYCAPCHARTGKGDGMIVQRGFAPPPSFHTQRLRDVPPGHVYNVITRGLGAMPDYRHQIPPYDRWAIAAYIKALQLTYNAALADVPPEHRPVLLEQTP